MRTGKKRRSYLKTSIAVDVEKFIVTAFKISGKPVHDAKHAMALLRQCHKRRKADCYLMDKGYDSEKIHALINEELKTEAIIPVRCRKRRSIKGNTVVK